jgi:glycerol kinase
VGFWKDQKDVQRNWALDREFPPAESTDAMQDKYARWKEAVKRSLDWE